MIKERTYSCKLLKLSGLVADEVARLHIEVHPYALIIAFVFGHGSFRRHVTWLLGRDSSDCAAPDIDAFVGFVLNFGAVDSAVRHHDDVDRLGDVSLRGVYVTLPDPGVPLLQAFQHQVLREDGLVRGQ